ncbi:MAG: MerC family mercury resistance protein [Acidobacteriota bacterium]
MKAISRALPAISGVLVSVLPVGICPVCWPVYAGLLSSFGLGFLLETAYLLPLTLALLAAAVAGLAYRARTRRGFGPLGLGLVASLAIVSGRFAAAIDPIVYVGIGLLIAAGLWNAWPKRAGKKDTCPACVSSPINHKGE